MAEQRIFAAICNAMADIEPVAKEQFNTQQKFKYRGIDDVMNAIFPVLRKHRLFLVPDVLEQRREERQTRNGGNLIYSILKVRYTMYTDDGSSVSAVVIGEGMDSADKSSNKAIAAAMKYAIFQIFCIPTEEIGKADPDGYSPPESQASPYNPMAEMDAIKAAYGLDKDGFAAIRKSLIDSGVIPDIPSAQMTQGDWEQLFAAIRKAYEGQPV